MANSPPNTIKTPIQIVWLADPEARDEEIYQQNLRIAFEGTEGKPGSPGSYLGPGLDLGIHVIAPKFQDLYEKNKRDSILKKISGGARRTIYITYLKKTPDRTNYPTAKILGKSICITHKKRNDRLNFKIIIQTESPEIANGEIQKRQGTSIEVEPTLRPMVLAIKVLLKALALIKSSKPDDCCISLFISHAKIDGIGAANAVLSAISTIALNTSLNKFYDAYDINSGAQWKQVLENSAVHERSVLIAIRSNQYEHRYWCQQEIQWAQQNFRPIIVADVRTQTTHPPSLIPLDIAGSYSLSDANAFKILYRAIAAKLRMARLQEMAVSHFDDIENIEILVLPHHPDLITVEALTRKAKEWRKDNKQFLILYPDPPMLPPALTLLKNMDIENEPSGKFNLTNHMTTFNRMIRHDNT